MELAAAAEVVVVKTVEMQTEWEIKRGLASGGRKLAVEVERAVVKVAKEVV